MALHQLTSVTIGVPNVSQTAGYYADFGLTDLGDGSFATIDGGPQLRIAEAPTRRLVDLWRASNFPDCGSFRILSWKGPMNCQENTRRIPRSSAMKPPAWWWRRHGPSLTSPVSLG